MGFQVARKSHTNKVVVMELGVNLNMEKKNGGGMKGVHDTERKW